VKRLAGRKPKVPTEDRRDRVFPRLGFAEAKRAAPNMKALPSVVGLSLNVMIPIPAGSKCINSPPTDQEIAVSSTPDE
jgi:hypothetical protein